MEKKLINYSVLAIEFVQGIITDNSNNPEQVEKTIRDTQQFIIQLCEEIVYDFEPKEEYENALMSMKIAEALYTPVLMYKKNIGHNQAEKEVKKQINELMTSYRNERENRKNNTDTIEDLGL
jgi:pyruvate/2-oxoacid:ferredoxin oxidoreductase alpha subunit